MHCHWPQDCEYASLANAKYHPASCVSTAVDILSHSM